MLNRPTITRLGFRTLHKSWDKLWRKPLAEMLGLSIAILVLLGLFILSEIIFGPMGKGDDTLPSIFLGLLTGLIGAGIIGIKMWWKRSLHAVHYTKEFRAYVNNNQKRYTIDRDQAVELLEYDDKFFSLDNFFTYIDTDAEKEMLPSIQRFGSTILQHKKGYLRLTLYWERGKGFYLTEEYRRNITAFN